MSNPRPLEPGEITELFDRLEPLDAASRLAILDAECSDRPELRREVEELLAALLEGQAKFGNPPVGVSDMVDSLQGYLLQGRRLGPFLIEGPLQEGGMSLVVRARDTRTGDEVALKLLAPELAGEPQWQRRFAREASALRSLSHPGVVKLLETGEDQGFSYFTMELIDGENLRQRMSRELPSLVESLGWVKGILDALGAAHAAGFLHGDLKPENIMLDSAGHIRLLDFGLTRPLAPNVPITQTASAVTGAIQYLSPERVAGGQLDARSDLFSIGVLLYEFLSGTTPFARPNLLATAAAILHEPAPELPAGVPVQLAALVRRCLEKDPELRPASAAVLALALDDALAGRYVKDSAGRRRVWPYVAAGLLCIAAAIVVWSIIPHRDTTTSIAVLPFTNFSANPADRYFSDCLTDEIANSLARVTMLRVIGRTSTSRFNGKTVDVREVGRVLNVASVLEGSLERSGGLVKERHNNNFTVC